MNILVDYQGSWGLGDLLCSDPMVLGLRERHGPDARIWLAGKTGNVIHNPLVAGLARTGMRFDRVVEVKLFSHMPVDEFARPCSWWSEADAAFPVRRADESGVHRENHPQATSPTLAHW